AEVDLTTGTQTGTTLEIPGEGYAVLSADGTRAVVTAYATDSTRTITNVAVIDMATGKQIGTTLSSTYPGYGSSSTQLVNAKAKRAVITTSSYNPAIVENVTRVAVIDTSTGSQIGTAVEITGEATAS